MVVSRSFSLARLIVPRDFDPVGQITKQRSEDLRKEFSRLEGLRLRTTVRYGPGDHGVEACEDSRNGGVSNKRKGGKNMSRS